MNSKRHRFLERSWRVLYFFCDILMKLIFNSEHDDIKVEGPCIVISNHVSSWDPLLLAHSFPRMKLYYVTSEHLFRLGIISRIISFFLEPIPRKKASMGTDTVMMCLRHLKAGHAVVLYAEGNATWDGISDKIFPATGKLVKNSHATLVTFRMEGGYLSAPRWGKGTRRGRVKGHRVGIYTPEELRSLTHVQINDIINRDIYENAWERQKEDKIRFKSRNPARCMERALFLCPRCHRIGGLKGEGSRIGCSCGFSTVFTEYGSFDPPEPFENIAQWDKWQHGQMKTLAFEHGDELFADEDMSLTEIGAEHKEAKLGRGRMSMTEDTLFCAGYSFPVKEIDNMSIVQAARLLFSHDGKYYQIRANSPMSHRKYLAVWKNSKEKAV